MNAALEITADIADAEPDVLTHSRFQKFKTCNLAHFFAYEMRLRRQRTSEPLSEGSAFHIALETYDFAAGSHEDKKAAGRAIVKKRYEMIPPWCVTDDEIHSWICQGVRMSVLFDLHCDYWVNDENEIVATEMAYDIPLPNPMTGATSRNFRQAGKIDRIVRLFDGRLAVQEYKTTSTDIGHDSDYWKRLRIDSQISGYVLAARAQGYPVETVLYDVTRKPALRPYKATPVELRKYKKDGELYANQREVNESPEEYGRRVYEAVRNDPQRYFRREEIVRLESDLREHQHDVWAQQKQIRACQTTGVWPRNTGSCIGHFGKCEFFDICTGGLAESVKAGVIPDGYRVAETMHEELADSNEPAE